MLAKHLIFLAILTTIFVRLFFRLLGKTDSRHTVTTLCIVVVALILYSVIAAFKMDQPSRGIVCPECKQPKNVHKLK